MKIQVEVLRGMRLYNTYYICKQCREMVNKLCIRQIGDEVYVILNWTQYKEVLFTIEQVDVLSKAANEFYEAIPVFAREKEKPEIDYGLKIKLESIKTNMIKTMDVIIELYESINDFDEEKGIDIKIPPCESLGQYISYLKEIDFIFSQCPLLKHKEGNIKFKTVDVGSQWISFTIVASVGGIAVTYILNNLALLIDKAIQIRSHIKNIEQQEEILRSMKLQNDVLESSLEGFIILKQHHYDEAIKAIEEENKDTPLKDGEERGKLEKCLEKLGELVDKGVEIYASINSDKDIQVLFPALEDKAQLPDSIIKFIEDKQNPEKK